MIELFINQIQALTGPLADDVFYTLDENQQGLWQYDPLDTTSNENIGTILKTADGKRIKRIYDGPVNVKWFGLPKALAVNNTNTLNNEIFNHFTNIYFPHDVYLCNKLVVAGNDMIITGDNAIIKMDSDGTSLSQLLEVTGTNVQIKDIVFDADNKEVSGYLCTVKPDAGVNFDHCVFRNIHGKGIGGTSAISNNQYAVVVSLLNVKFGFNNCTFTDLYNENMVSPRPYVGGGFVGGICFGDDTFNGYSSGTDQPVPSAGYIENCNFTNIITILSDGLSEANQTDYNDADCIRTYGNKYKVNRLNLTINNCIFKNYSKRGIKLTSTDNIIITNTRYIINGPPLAPEKLQYKVVSAIDIRANNVFVDNVNVESAQSRRHTHLLAVSGLRNITIRNVFADHANSFIVIFYNPDWGVNYIMENYTFYNVSCRNVYFAGIIQATANFIEMKSWTIEKYSFNACSEDESGNTVPAKGIPAINLYPQKSLGIIGLLECRFSDINITNGYIKLAGIEYTIDKLTMIIDSVNYGLENPTRSLMELQDGVTGTNNNVVIEDVLIKVQKVNLNYYTSTRSYLVFLSFNSALISNFRLYNYAIYTTPTPAPTDIIFANTHRVNNYDLQYFGPNNMKLNGATYLVTQITNASFSVDSAGAVIGYTNIS